MANTRLRTPADIGALIKDRRRALRLDQAALAQQIGVSRLWVNQVEGGKPGASLALVLRALDAVGVQLSGQAGEAAAPEGTPGDPVITPDINAIVTDARRKDRP